jgi:hypothetical protein
MADEHARIDPLPAAVDTAFANPAPDRLADVSDALATTLTSHLAHEETDALSLIRTLSPAPSGKRGMADSHSHRPSTGAEFFALMLDGLSRRRGCYRGLETPVGKVSH